MKLSFAILSFVVLSQIAGAIPQGQANKGTIEGIVTRADNGQPVVGAQIILSSVNVALATGGGAPSPPPSQYLNTPPPQIAPGTTDADGKFQFKDLEPGTYRLIAAAPGYIRREYGQRSAAAGSGSGTPIVLTAGQKLKNAAIHLTATGAVSGRIFDDYGQPAIGVPVLILQYQYDAMGVKTLRQIAMGNANDRGEYRIYGVTPGRYVVAVGDGPDLFQAARGAPRGYQSGVNYAFSYFPGVSEPGQATIIEIIAGGEAVADMKTGRRRTQAVRGRVIDSTGQTIASSGARGQSSISVLLTYNLFDGGGSLGGSSRYDPSTGNFAFQGVIPGVYILQAQMRGASPQVPVTTAANVQDLLIARAGQPIAEVPIVVGNADVENVLLTFSTPLSLPGKLSIEGQDLTSIPLDRIRLQFRRLSNGLPISVGTAPQTQPLKSDGTFQVTGMRAGEYLISLFGIPPTHYVKSLQFDDKDYLGKTMDYLESSGRGFNIVLSPKPGQISGVVTDAKMQPVPGVQAVIIPDVKLSRTDLYKSGTTDKNGRFSVTGVTPGDYKVFAWDGLEPYRYFDPDFLKTYETKGQSIRIGESAKAIVNIQVISIPEE